MYSNWMQGILISTENTTLVELTLQCFQYEQQRSEVFTENILFNSVASEQWITLETWTKVINRKERQYGNSKLWVIGKQIM